MIYPHQQKAIDYIINKFQSDYSIDALLISGSIAHGFNDENSDVDINIVVSNELYEQKKSTFTTVFWESASDFYDGGYFDGKYITLDYLSMVAERGNEPIRFALHDALITFDRTGKVADYQRKIGTYNTEGIQENAVRFVSQLDAWKWYCDEALKKGNQYLLELSVSKLILFAGRLILLDNRILFPYHKWFMRVLADAPHKPAELMNSIQSLLKDKSPDNITRFYDLVKTYKDWTDGVKYSWPSHFVHDVETVWMRGDDFIENI